MRVHYLQHVPFEGLGSIAPWLEARGARVTSTRLYEDPRLPGVERFDWLIVMGGPMSANDDDLHPWLPRERELVAESVEAGKTVLGICLGAQLLARALGARVYRSPEPEIGWFRVDAAGGEAREPGPDAMAADSGDPGPLTLPIDAFHWHGETFDLPLGATHLARSAACAHQAFSVGPRVLGLQFHLEMTPAGVRALVDACGDELRTAPCIQSQAEMLRDPQRFERIRRAMDATLAWLARP